MRARWGATVLAVIVCVPLAHAGPGYVGASIGASAAETEIDLIQLDETDLGLKLFGGYRFTDHFGLEAGYIDLGSQETTQLGATLKTEAAGWNLVGVGIAPIGERFEFFGKAGLLFAETKIFSTGGVEPFESDDREADLMLGVGGAYRFSRLAVRVELEFFDNEQIDTLLLLSAGLEYRF